MENREQGKETLLDKSVVTDSTSSFWQKLKSSKWCFLFLIIIIWFLFWVMNSLTLYISDDWRAAQFVNGNVIRKVPESFSVVIEEAWNAYLNFDGRGLSHVILRSFDYVDKSIFNIINSFIVTLTIILLYFHITGKRQCQNWLLLLIFFLFSFFAAGLCEATLWYYGSFYLYTIMLMLLITLPFRRELETEQPIKYEWLIFILFIPFLFYLGNVGAQVTVGTFIFFILYFLYCKYFHLSVLKSTYFSFAILLVAFCIFYLSPGTRYRASLMGEQHSIITNIILFVLTFHRNYIYLIIFWIISLVTFIFFPRTGEKTVQTKKIVCLSLIYGITSLCTYMAMLPAGSRCERTFFGACLIMIPAILIPLSQFQLPGDSKKWLKLFNIALLFIVLLIPLRYAQDLKCLFMIRQSYVKCFHEIEKQKAEGKQDIVLEKVPVHDFPTLRYFYNAPCKIKPNIILGKNSVACQVFEVNSIQCQQIIDNSEQNETIIFKKNKK